MRFTSAMTAIALTLGSSAVAAADVAHGKVLFQQRCTLCHSAESGDGGGEQGPGLADVVGRQAASVRDFPYSSALRQSRLTWDVASLDTFLTAPGKLVPGTNMFVTIPQPQDRQDVVAYLQSVHGTNAAGPTAPGAPGSTSAPALGAPNSAASPAPNAAVAPEPIFPDWRTDTPGRQQHLSTASLPAPFASPSSTNRVKVVPRPADAHLNVPPGFEVTQYATGIEGARQVRVAPNGDVFVTSQQSGRLFVLRSALGASQVGEVQTFAAGLKQPFGIAFYPSGSKPQWLYLAEENRIVRFPYQNGDLHARGEPQVVVDPLSPETGGHGAHDLLFSRDGKQFFVAVGSASDAAVTGLPPKSAAEIAAWESDHGLGAAWGTETGRASVLKFDARTGRGQGAYATGIRNCGTMALHPASAQLWCVSTERNQLGDDLAPDYLTRVREGAFYGWPWYYTGTHEDPRHRGERPDLADKVTAPDVLFTPHSAPLSLTFYTATSGPSLFPRSYRGDVFVAMHGSWNRSRRSGHKVVRVHVKEGVPTGEFEDFLTGFVVDDNTAWGRPVAVTVARDGALLVSDDAAGAIWRVAPRH